MDGQKPIVFLGDDVLYLRPVEAGDIERMQRWINDPEIRHWLKMDRPMSFLAEKAWVENIMKGSTTGIVFAIVLRDSDQHIGTIALHRINWKDRVATTGSMLDKEFWSKGYGSRAKILLLMYAFMTLGLHKICSRAYAYNVRSQGALKKCGYVQEGISRKEFFRDGKFHDVVDFGILAEEFEPVWQKYLSENKKEAV